MTPEELAAIRKKGEKCRAKGCKCLARCYHAFNKWWMEKASVCTHPNWCPADDEWWENLPPLVGNKPRPQLEKQRPTTEQLKQQLQQGTLI